LAAFSVSLITINVNEALTILVNDCIKVLGSKYPPPPPPHIDPCKSGRGHFRTQIPWGTILADLF
jgi:hypothetical protein